MKYLEDNPIHELRQFFSGKSMLKNESMFFLTGLTSALLHLIFMVVFLVNHCWIIGFYNIAAVIYYLIFALVVARLHYVKVNYLMLFFEIIIHSVLATYLIGWGCGFMTYTLALIPMAYYFGYAIPSLRDRHFIPVITSLIETGAYLGMLRVTDLLGDTMYSGSASAGTISFFRFFNRIIALSLLALFSFMFSMEMKYMNRQLERENLELFDDANHDMLTELLNRRGMQKHFDNAFERANKGQCSFGIIMSDIDHFKKFNDTFGHDCGDAVLIKIGQIIKRGIRQGDHACRWGGEELLILVKGDREAVIDAAERLHDEIQNTVMDYKGQSVNITVTMGVAIYEPGVTQRELIEDADKSLYYGKQNGRNRVVYIRKD